MEVSSTKIPYVIRTSLHNALMTSWFVLAGMSMHAPCWLSVRSCSEGEHQSGCFGHPFFEGRNVSPRYILWHSSPGPFMHPHVKSARVHFILNHVKRIFTGMYKLGYAWKQSTEFFCTWLVCNLEQSSHSSHSSVSDAFGKFITIWQFSIAGRKLKTLTLTQFQVLL